MYSVLQNESHARNRSCHRARDCQMPRVAPFFSLTLSSSVVFAPRDVGNPTLFAFLSAVSALPLLWSFENSSQHYFLCRVLKACSNVCQAMFFFSQDATLKQILSKRNRSFYERKYLKHRNEMNTVHGRGLTHSWAQNPPRSPPLFHLPPSLLQPCSSVHHIFIINQILFHHY